MRRDTSLTSTPLAAPAAFAALAALLVLLWRAPAGAGLDAARSGTNPGPRCQPRRAGEIPARPSPRPPGAGRSAPASSPASCRSSSSQAGGQRVLRLRHRRQAQARPLRRLEGKRRLLASNESAFHDHDRALGLLGPGLPLQTSVKADGDRRGRASSRATCISSATVIRPWGDRNRRSRRRRPLRRDQAHLRGGSTATARSSTACAASPTRIGGRALLALLSGSVYGGSTYAEDPAKECRRAFRDAAQYRRQGRRQGQGEASCHGSSARRRSAK